MSSLPHLTPTLGLGSDSEAVTEHPGPTFAKIGLGTNNPSPNNLEVDECRKESYRDHSRSACLYFLMSELPSQGS